jgi:hypothetical protein
MEAIYILPCGQPLRQSRAGGYCNEDGRNIINAIAAAARRPETARQ